MIFVDQLRPGYTRSVNNDDILLIYIYTTISYSPLGAATLLVFENVSAAVDDDTSPVIMFRLDHRTETLC